MIPIFYKKMTSIARVFTEEEKNNIIKDITSSTALRKKIEELISNEQTNRGLAILQKIITLVNEHPYITGGIIVSLSLIIGISIYKNYSNIIHWDQNLRNVNNLAEDNLQRIQTLRERTQQIANIVRNQGNQNLDIALNLTRLLAVLASFFVGGIDISTNSSLKFSVNINPSALLNLQEKLDTLIKDMQRLTGYMSTPIDHNLITNKEEFKPFTGEGHLSGKKDQDQEKIEIK
jgi:hypothetical protein